MARRLGGAGSIILLAAASRNQGAGQAAGISVTAAVAGIHPGRHLLHRHRRGSRRAPRHPGVDRAAWPGARTWQGEGSRATPSWCSSWSRGDRGARRIRRMGCLNGGTLPEFTKVGLSDLADFRSRRRPPVAHDPRRPRHRRRRTAHGGTRRGRTMRIADARRTRRPGRPRRHSDRTRSSAARGRSPGRGTVRPGQSSALPPGAHVDPGQESPSTAMTWVGARAQTALPAFIWPGQYKGTWMSAHRIPRTIPAPDRRHRGERPAAGA